MTGDCYWKFNTANSDQQGKIYGHSGERLLLLVQLQTLTPFLFCCPSLIEMSRDPFRATTLQEWQYKLIKETMYRRTFSSMSMIYVVLSPSPIGYYDFNTSCSKSIILTGKSLSKSVYVRYFKNKYSARLAAQLCLHKVTINLLNYLTFENKQLINKKKSMMPSAVSTTQL